MKHFNQAIILGKVIYEIEVRTLPGGKAVCNFIVATNSVWTKEDKQVEKTEFHRVAAFGKVAELVGQYVVKGDAVMVQGRLQTKQWEKDGVQHQKTEIVADNIVFLK